jgi:NAD(P)-dependent dehydrogenase (short-subunit alcohol dehydrogenase family)
MSEGRLAGKRVIVTGAAGGLGRSFALHLATVGARVVASDVREQELAETCALAEERGAAVVAVTADVGSAEETKGLAEAAAGAFGGVDALVNNAAVVEGLKRRPFDEVPGEEWDRVLRVNAKGPWLCAKAVVPMMRETGAGSIVYLSSEVAFSGSPGVVHYVTSKAAVVGLTRALARELGPSGVRVNAIAPGFIPTPGSQGLIGAGGYDASLTPLGRVGEPEDMLGALTFLISEESAFVTGQTLLVNGGRLFH